MTSEETAENPGEILPPGRRWTSRRRGLSIQSKLLVMLLVVSLASSAVVGVIGYLNGRDSLRDAAFEQLITIREMRSEAVEREFASLQLGIRLDSRNESAIQSTRAFVDGFADLKNTKLTPAQDERIDAFYEDEFIPQLEARSGNDYAADAFVPVTAAGRYLQYHYTANHGVDEYDAALVDHDAGDGSAWSQANSRYGPYFAGLVDQLGYEDVLVLDLKGNVVYSAYKSVDFGVNMQEEPYTNSALTTAYKEVLRSGSLDSVVTTDFERYLPSLNVPTSWVLSPVGTSTEVVGVMAVQVPITQINDVMTGGETWSAQGLGETGEVYLAGTDELMRSTSRLLVEKPDDYAKIVTEQGTPPATAERIAEVKGTVLLQPVGFDGAQEALKGKSGTTITNDYVSQESLIAYAPVQVEGLNWMIVARIDADEAFEPVSAFTRALILSTLAIMLAVSLLSLVFAQAFTRPISRLVDAVRRVAGGDLAVQVPADSKDEFGDLGTAFNDMSNSLRIKQGLIEEQSAENESLLLTLMPEPVAKRYREGEENIVQEHQNVSVVFAEVVGLDGLATELTTVEQMERSNALLRSFDEAAERTGVESVRKSRGTYLASSGLVVPRVDNVRRAVDFGIELRTIVDRFNAQNGTDLTLRVGVDTGTVTSGLLGRTSVAYDLWGDAVSLAHRVQLASGEPGIFVSQAVRDRLLDSVPTVATGTIETSTGAQSIWRIER